MGQNEEKIFVEFLKKFDHDKERGMKGKKELFLTAR